MSLSVGIIGLPNVGKSSLFKALTKQEVAVANYPFTTINPNVGVVAVPDERLEKIFQLSRTAKMVPATIEFVDLAGLVKNAHQGQGLGNQFLAQLREVEAILHLLRCFHNETVVHLEGEINPLKDLEIINLELIFKDLETIEKVLNRLNHEVKSGEKEKLKEKEKVEQVKELLSRGELLNNYPALINEPVIKNLSLLTAKPQLYVLNGKREEVPAEVLTKIKELNSDYLILDLAQPEQQLTASLVELVKRCFQLLGLITFFTFVGENETRAWVIKRGTKLPQAAGVIHTDFEKNFIRAEVIDWEKLVEAGSWQKAKEKGWVRTEGKDYVVQEGEVVVVKYSA